MNMSHLTATIDIAYLAQIIGIVVSFTISIAVYLVSL